MTIFVQYDSIYKPWFAYQFQESASVASISILKKPRLGYLPTTQLLGLEKSVLINEDMT
jgi:hypothetical protein